MHHLRDKRFLRFIVVGAVNTAFGYSVFALLILAGAHYAVAALLSTICGVLFNFRTTGRFVFKNRDSSLLLRFAGVYAICYVAGVLLLRFSRALGVDILLAAAVLAFPMAVFSYTLNRLLVFRVAV
jgi:putative flippase GtrA